MAILPAWRLKVLRPGRERIGFSARKNTATLEKVPLSASLNGNFYKILGYSWEIGFDVGTPERMHKHSAHPESPVPSALIFDSGVGAISIAREIRRLIPGLTLHLGVDNGFYPYGNKSEEELRPRIVQQAQAMMEHCGADILVVGCNTASTLALPQLRESLQEPVVGVVPAVKPAAAASRSRTIALIATEGTVNRRYTRELIEQFANGNRVINVPAPELVYLAESKLRGEAVTAEDLEPVLHRVFHTAGGDQVDIAVLACTHFPLLREELDQFAPRSIQWLDSGEAIARRVRWWLEELKLILPDSPNTGRLITSTVDLTGNIEQAFREFAPVAEPLASNT
ncbi:glutamate racemase [Microbulbifer sp. OS29]|uniref:Glutamate racemase n=1 Tax=Microbulbifer okhotskensis TaxID=2926617 RepID=A0A9X2EQX5_9GAMM|nr:glutamate racemase [Microbulbifer okhotskensis]MCO1336189.1 glutamate racemase [Microbulbifer okhotskensis]